MAYQDLASAAFSNEPPEMRFVQHPIEPQRGYKAAADDIESWRTDSDALTPIVSHP